MLHTVIDYNLFDHFTRHQPAQIPVGTAEENEYWHSFWKFLKEQSHVTLTNYQNQENIFLNVLTTGRKGTKFLPQEKFSKPHKYKFPKGQNPRSVFFLNEPEAAGQQKYRKQNGFLFGFPDDYPETWKKLSLLGKADVLPVRKDEEKRFSKWDQLSEYITPFTDLIMVDNYMFDESLWDYNLFEILRLFSQKTPVKFNLLLVSFADNKKLIGYANLGEKVKEKLKEMGISCNFSLVLAPQTLKEHDRGIFTNYLRIKSGDSFVYFDKTGKYLTKGTDIDFHTLASPNKFNASEAALRNVARILTELKTHPEREKRLFGDLKNGLLEHLTKSGF